jgi:hypothetical protein
MDSCLENIMNIITTDENFDIHNNPDNFSIHKDWNIIVLYNNSGEFSDDETIQMNIDEIIEMVGQDVWKKWDQVYVNAEKE